MIIVIISDEDMFGDSSYYQNISTKNENRWEKKMINKKTKLL